MLARQHRRWLSTPIAPVRSVGFWESRTQSPSRTLLKLRLNSPSPVHSRQQSLQGLTTGLALLGRIQERTTLVGLVMRLPGDLSRITPTRPIHSVLLRHRPALLMLSLTS